MEWDPTARLDVEKVALPLETLALPSVVVPSLKVTVPVAETLPVKVAVRVTGLPKAGAASDDPTEIEGVARETVRPTALAVAFPLLASPP